MNNYYIEFHTGHCCHRKFESDRKAIKYYDKSYFGGLKLFRENSIGKFELIFERKRKK
jgi:hypothetical protein